jgi:hypothetical protein
MFVHDFVHIGRRLQEVKAEVLADHGRWLRPLATTNGDELRLRVGPTGIPTDHPLIGKQIRVEVGEPREVVDAVVVPMRWEATGVSGLFPTLEADLEFGALGPERTRISLSGRYEVPFGRVGRTVDDLLLHGLAEETVREFLKRLAKALEERRVDSSSC